jgi:hypothetical protein
MCEYWKDDDGKNIWKKTMEQMKKMKRMKRMSRLTITEDTGCPGIGWHAISCAD